MPRNGLTPFQDSEVLTFLRTYRTKQGDVPTHLCMAGSLGGSFTIPHSTSHRQRFFKKVADDIRAKIPLFLVELRTAPVFRCFFDLDFRTNMKSGWSDAQRTYLVSEVVACIRQFLPNTAASRKKLLCVVAAVTNPTDNTVPEEEKDDTLSDLFDVDEKDATNTEEETTNFESLHPPVEASKSANLHLHFHNLMVTSEQAATMARGLVCYLENRVGQLSCVTNTWPEIIDETVYVGSGLRLPGCSKSGKCKSCGGRGCDACNMVGKINLGRIYRVVQIYSATESGIREEPKYLEQIRANFSRELTACSIRATPTAKKDSTWSIPKGCPGIDAKLLETQLKRRSSVLSDTKYRGATKFRLLDTLQHKNSRLAVISANEIKFERNGRLNIRIDGEIAQLLRQAITDYHPSYKHLQIRKIRTNVRISYYSIFVRGVNSTFCHNLPPSHPNHTSHNIYFYATVAGLVQKCFCDCKGKPRLNNETCISFTGPRKEFTDDLKILLFPNVKPRSNPFEYLLQTRTSDVEKQQWNKQFHIFRRESLRKGLAHKQLLNNIATST